MLGLSNALTKALHARIEMHYEWILDVLTDLKTFAKSNGLPALAEQLDDTALLAAAEIAQVSGELAGGSLPHGNTARAFHWGSAAGEVAG